MSTLLSDADIHYCIKEYLINNKTSDLIYLTPDVVPEKYRVLPKGGWLYRGEQRMLHLHPTKEELYVRGGFKSYTTSMSNAKDFARGICGNDYPDSAYHRMRSSRLRAYVTRYGFVYRYKPTLDEVVLSIGKFLRATNPDDELKTFKHENEYLLKPSMGRVIHKEDILWVTNKVVFG